MAFIRRDASGKIEAVALTRVGDTVEEIALDHPELQRFLAENVIEAIGMKEWVASDLAFVRVVEDLMDLLIDKGTFRVTDLPAVAQTKIMSRRGLRKHIAYVESLFGNEEGALGEEPAQPEEGKGETYL